jgi:ankyrin repeat protein
MTPSFEKAVSDVSGNVAEIQSIQGSNSRGQTCLHIAAEKRKKETFQILLSRVSENISNLESRGSVDLESRGSVDIENRDPNDWTPLHYAAQNGSYEIVETLISKVL